MSYNITTWKTKKIDGLRIPIDCFNGKKHKHYQQEVNINNSHVVIEAGEGKIEGYLQIDNTVYITDIEISGETSGTFFREVFYNALEYAEGTMEAVLIWECGDSITRLIVGENDYSNEEIDL